MKYKVLIKAAIDAFIHLLGLIVLNELIIADETCLSMKRFMYIGAIEAIMAVILYVIIVMKESRNRDIVICLLVSSLFCTIGKGILLMISLIFPVPSSYIGETNNAYGIIMIFSLGLYILASYVLKILASVILIMKNIIKKRMNVDGIDGLR